MKKTWRRLFVHWRFSLKFEGIVLTWMFFFLFFFTTSARGIRLGCTAACWLIVQPWIPLPFHLILDVPSSAARCLHVHTTRETLLAKCGTSWSLISPTISIFTLHVGIFYMLQICDMGPTALLPLRRKECRGFFSPLKIRGPGFEPVNLGTKG
jgi:hypothetical protein